MFYLIGRIIKDRLTLMKWIIFAGIVLAGVSIIIFPLSERPFFLLTTFLICGIGIGAALPCLDALITKSLKKSVRGTIISIYSAMRFVGVATGPPATALLMEHHIGWFVGLLIFFSVIAGILSFWAINPET